MKKVFIVIVVLCAIVSCEKQSQIIPSETNCTIKNYLPYEIKIEFEEEPVNWSIVESPSWIKYSTAPKLIEIQVKGDTSPNIKSGKMIVSDDNTETEINISFRPSFNSVKECIKLTYNLQFIFPREGSNTQPDNGYKHSFRYDSYSRIYGYGFNFDGGKGTVHSSAYVAGGKLKGYSVTYEFDQTGNTYYLSIKDINQVGNSSRYLYKTECEFSIDGKELIGSIDYN